MLAFRVGTNNGARAAGRRLPALARHALCHGDRGDAARLRADQAGARAQAALNGRIQQELGDLGKGKGLVLGDLGSGTQKGAS